MPNSSSRIFAPGYLIDGLARRDKVELRCCRRTPVPQLDEPDTERFIVMDVAARAAR
jgi:hypothetical protein